MKNNPVLFRFRNNPTQNVFAPTWNYQIYEDLLTQINFKTLTQFILEKEKEIINKKNVTISGDGYTGLGTRALTSHYNQYNLLDWDHSEIPLLQQAILKTHSDFLHELGIPLYPELYIQCWANVMREGEQIKPHLHSVHENSYLGGHIVVQAQKTHTHYINPVNQINGPDIHSSSNIVGKISLFPSCVPHYTDMQKSGEPRITIAFDLFVNRSVVKPNYRKIRGDTGEEKEKGKKKGHK